MKKMLLAGLLFSSLAACNFETPELPAETQIGADTFGCLVDGELVIPFNQRYHSYEHNAGAKYDRAADTLRITGFGQDHQPFYLTVAHPEANHPAPIDRVEYHFGANYYYGGQGVGQITLTRFDARVVSGTFEFVARKYSFATGAPIDPTGFVTVSMGRFDIRMNVY